MIERRSTRPDSCGQGAPEVTVNADVTSVCGGYTFNPGIIKGTVLVGTGSRSDTITRAQDCDTRSPSIEYVSHTKERPKSNLNYTKRSLRGVIHPSTAPGRTRQAAPNHTGTQIGAHRKPNRPKTRTASKTLKPERAVSAIHQPLTACTARMRPCQRWDAARHVRGAQVKRGAAAACCLRPQCARGPGFSRHTQPGGGG